MEAIRTENLTKRYKQTVVDGLSFSVEEGELFALLGVNGAGKTTTVRMLSCLTRPSAGDAWLLGRSVVSQSGGVKEIIAGNGGGAQPEREGESAADVRSSRLFRQKEPGKD